ncbi:MAG: hypothetical protein ACLQU1_37970 [Bryobacteraceae bacterium]
MTEQANALDGVQFGTVGWQKVQRKFRSLLFPPGPVGETALWSRALSLMTTTRRCGWLPGGIRCENRVHFLALCSQIIRPILVDHARSRG